MYHLRKLRSMLLLLLVAVTAKAQLSDGKVYNFVNVGNTGKSMTALTLSDLSIATTDITAAEQLWYAEEVSDDVFALRNLYSGYYLHSPNKQSNTNWTLVNRKDESCNFTCTTAGNGYALRATNTTDSGLYMHYGASTNRIVCWDAAPGTTASHWTITEVEKTVPIQEFIDNFPNPDTYQPYLVTLFEDLACTSLKAPYSLMDVETLKIQDAYVALPATLQQMVLKVRGGDDSWGEENLEGKSSWDASYAKKYRVQLYEPYSELICGSTALSLNWHTSLNNPTGIFANERELLYIMVEGEIKEGASLYLTSYTGNGRPGINYNEGVELRPGLNIVPSLGNGNNYCINYAVNTFDTSDGKRGHKAKARPLSQYPALKIHIEGGHINGYYNKMGDALYTPDKNDDWDYLEERATQTTVTILGKYMTLQFPLNDEDTEGNKGLSYYLNDKVKVEDVINSWDNVMMWERLLLGVLDEETVNAEAKQSPYSNTQTKRVFEYTGDDADFPAGYGDYYNVHGLALGVGGSAFMYGSGDHSGYHYNTMSGVIQMMTTNAGSHWGPAHEIGHQHQNLIKMRGETEVSNNLFSNVVLWFFGETTSRVNGTDGSLENILKNFNSESGHYLNNSIWGMTHMYYKLFLYYHVLGHNPKFYPRLFEMLRQDPQVNNLASVVDGSNAQLHLYKKMCLAAGEDLTEFFRAHGFFKPLNGFVAGDYGNSAYYMTQDQIDTAIAEVKAWADEKGWKQNISVLFINDATGEPIKSHKGDDLELYGETRVCAEVGSYASFNENATEANYTCSMSGNTVTMTGEGGVGFVIFNEKGELIAFSDKKTFEISSECAAAIMSGTATINAMNADNEVVEIEYDEVGAMSALLGGLLDEVSGILALSDSDNSHPGFYRSSVLAALQQAYDNAIEVFEKKTSSSYATMYEVLNREYNAVKDLTTDKTPFLPGSTYVLTNNKYPEKSMTINSASKLVGSNTDLSSTAQQWIFEPATEADTYYLKNAQTQMYLDTLKKSIHLGVTEKAKAPSYKLYDLGKGLWALQCQNGVEEQMSLHCDGSKNVVGWWHTSSDNDGSWWYLTATSKDESALPLYNLQELIGKTEALIDEVGEAKMVKLQATDADADYYLYCNALFNKSAGNNSGDNSMNTAKLLDGDPATHIHTDNNTTAAGYKADDNLDHYLRVDMGTDNAISTFKFTYTTRNAGTWHNHPKVIRIEGSNNLTVGEFTHIKTITDLQDQTGWTYTSDEIVCDEPYRYIRFMVTDTHSNSSNNYKSYGDHPYFYMAEFNLLVNDDVKVDNEYAEEITVGELTAAFESLSSAQEIVRNAESGQYSAAYTTLLGYYENLLAGKERAETASLSVLKAQLLTLMGETTALINSCGEVTYTPGTFDGKAKLQTKNANASFYLWTNAQSKQEGSIAYLIDGNNNTYFHSDYSGNNSTDELDHHITVNLGKNNKASNFTFKYVTRHNAGTNYPTTMTIWGSEDGEIYEVITLLTNLPTGQTKTYESGRISAGKEYAHLRFMVTGNDNTNTNNGIKGGHPIFHMAEFELNVIGTPESCTAVLNPETAGDADTDLLIETYRKNAEAQATYDYATTESQVEAAIIKLTAAKEALTEAKNASREYSVTVVGGNGQGGVRLDGNDYFHGKTFRGPSALTESDLAAISVDGYTEGVITMEGTAITVTYKMIYRVEVVGGDGNGGVTFEEIDYNHGAEVHALTAITLNELTAVDGSDYVGTITLDGRTIRVTYCKLVKNLSELRNYKAYHIRARSGEGYFAWNRSITDTYVSLRGMTNSSHNNLPANQSVVNTYKEAVGLSDKTVVWQIIKEGNSYYLYQPEKKAYVTRSGRDYLFTADTTALDGIRQNSGEYAGTFGIHAGGGYSDGSTNFACIVTNEASIAVRNWTWSDHGSVLQIIENPYVYALDYEVKVVGNANGGVEFEEESYTDGETLSATELLTASDLMVKSIGGYEHKIEVNKDKDNATITITYTAIDKTELINLITETQTLVDEASGYLGSSLNVTEALIEETNEVLATAIEVRDNSSVNREEYEAALAALQAAKSKLATAIAYAELPVQLTFDVNSPVTYKITINRGGYPVLAYNSESTMVAVTNFDLVEDVHKWYFMAATDGKIRIMPYFRSDSQLALSTNSFSEGNSKVLGMAIDTEEYTQEWTITANSSHAGWYNITTINPDDKTTWYFSNHGGVGNKMGFYNVANDPGSLFKFGKVRFDISDAYCTLYNYYSTGVRIAGNVTGGNALGDYPVEAANAYNAAYNHATMLLESFTATDGDYTAAYKALKAANESLEIIGPKAGSFYTVKNDDYYITGSTTSSDKIALSTTKDADAIYYYDGSHLLSYNTGLYMGLNTNDWTFEAVGSNDISIVEFVGAVNGAAGAFNIKCGGRWLHRTNAYVNRCSENTCGDAHNWIIEEVTELPVNVNVNLGFASFYAPVALRMPKGMTAYVVTGVDDDKAPIAVLAEEREVIPANTGVLLNAEGGNYNLAIADNAEAKVLEEVNLLHGTIDDQYIEYGNNTHYMLGYKNKVAGLYVVAKNLTSTGQKDEENGTYFKNNGFKSYLTVSGELEVNALRFFVETTEIDEMEAAGNGQQEAYIYDLQGRRVLNPTNGMYIVNGKKVVIK